MKAFPLVESCGDSFQVGLQHGEQAREQIAACLDRLCPVQARSESCRVLARRIERGIQHRMPEALEEIRGIAAGSGQTYDDILLLNLAIELRGEDILPPRPACTLIGASGRETLVAKSIDVGLGDDRFLICQRVCPDKGYGFLHITYAGTIWTDGGVNVAGLVQTNSSLVGRHCDWSAFPVFIMARRLLQECGNTQEAISFQRNYHTINWGANILIGDARGEITVLEKIGTQTCRLPQVTRSRGGQMEKLVCAGNHRHFSHPPTHLTGNHSLETNSRMRLNNLSRRLGRMEVSAGGIIELLQDHSRQGAICQHGQDGLHTVGAIIASSQAFRLHVARGYPCQSPFFDLSLA